MKKVTYILAAMALSAVIASCSSNISPKSESSSGIAEDNTSKLKDVAESKSVPDEILAAISNGAEQKMLVGFDETVGGVAQRKITGDKVYVVVTASLGTLSESDKYNVSLTNGKVVTVIGSLIKIAENQYQLKYAGPTSMVNHSKLEVKQASSGKVIFSGEF